MRDDAYVINHVVSFEVMHSCGLGDEPIEAVTEDDLKAFAKHLVTVGRAFSTRNHPVQLIRAMSRVGREEGYRPTPLIHDDSNVVRRRKGTQRHRRLERGEKQKLLAAAESRLSHDDHQVWPCQAKS